MTIFRETLLTSAISRFHPHRCEVEQVWQGNRSGNREFSCASLRHPGGKNSRIINGTSYYPPHPGPGARSLEVSQQQLRTTLWRNHTHSNKCRRKERITATKPTECISYVVGRVKIPLSGREQNWNKVNIIPHLNCLGKAISSLNRFKIGLPKDNNNRFSVKNCYSSTRSSLHYRARLDPTAIITLFNSSVAILTKWSLQSGPLWKASWR